MSEKPLKKQLYASIAMTLVAAVALGSSTFAWFVTNNSVKSNDIVDFRTVERVVHDYQI